MQNSPQMRTKKGTGKNVPFNQTYARPQPGSPKLSGMQPQDGSYMMPLRDPIGNRGYQQSPGGWSDVPPSPGSAGSVGAMRGGRKVLQDPLLRSYSASPQSFRKHLPGNSPSLVKIPRQPNNNGSPPLKKQQQPGLPAAKKSERAVSPSGEEDSSQLAFLFLAMIFFGSAQKIYSKLQCYPMHDYPIFLSLAQVAAYVPLCFSYIIPVLMFWPARISPEQRAIPKYKFAIMGLLDSFSSTAQTFAVNYITNASMIILIQQSAIPISMVISAIFLHARYTKYQYWGATVVMCGIVVCVLPNLAGGSSGGSSEALWMGVLVLSCIPMCFSSVYKEKALGEVDMDVVYLNGWVAWYQFIVTLCLAVPSAYAMGYSLQDIPQNIMDGFSCYLGTQPADRIAEEAMVGYYSCSESMILVNLYIFFNVGYNILLILILKYGSANILWLASTVMVPFGNIVFSFKFVPGHQPLTSSNFWSLGLIMGGLVLYRFYGNFVTWLKQRKVTIPKDLQETERQQKEIVHLATHKMKNFVGINQAEFLEPMVEARIYEEQKAMLYRSTVQIRGSFLARLGLPPSPGLTSTPRTRRNLLNQRNPRRKVGSERSPLLFDNKRCPQRKYAVDV
mmetsp:Transcript_28230/g.35448  ORF Transcript_28230/g.35448 Transcript_28230/m.35448 type:complete len:617 (+) Transcript_28230:130-1980(+)